MNKELIEKIINIAIENGYNPWDEVKTIDIDIENALRLWGDIQIGFNWRDEKKKCIWRNLSTILTSKEFIDAFCKYLWMNEKDYKNFKNMINWTWDETINDFTCEQAIAIRDWKLEEFYKQFI